VNIVLIGYRGTGKSVVGRIVAEKLGRECLAMDAMIVEGAGMSVPEIVEKEGWPGFRDRETRLARDLAERDDIVIDCGGGVIERPENMEALRSKGIVIWLKASVDVIVERISGDTERPALVEGKTFTEEVAEVLERRTPLYRDSSHHEIDTDSLTPEEIAEQVVGIFQAVRDS
jgi:shikimate kinase